MKPIPGYEGRYSVTKNGRIFSHVRKNGYLNLAEDKDGYLFVCLHKDGIQKNMRVHQAMSRAYFGGEMLDHIDRNPRNNTLRNLRPCTTSQNRANSKIMANNTSGFAGVSWLKNKRRWLVRLQVNKKRIRIGSFREKTEAAKAYKEAVEKYFGIFSPWLTVSTLSSVLIPENGAVHSRHA